MATPFYLVSHDAQQALTEFSNQFDLAFSAADPETQWCREGGFVNSSRAIKTTYPIPLDAAGYKKRGGDEKMRRLYVRSLSMKPVEWYDGVEELASIVEAPDFIGWAGAPARIAREGIRFPNKLVATMLHANPLLDLYKEELPGGSVASTIRLFADVHPVNVLDDSFGTFDNDKTGTGIDAATIKDMKHHFRSIKAANGEHMGLNLTHVYVPAALEEAAKDFFESDNLILAVENAGGTIVGGVPTNNRHKGTVTVVVCQELLDDNMIYGLDLSADVPAWILQDGGAPEEIVYDKTDAKYKDTGMIGNKYVMLMAVAACLPHAIVRYTIS